MQEIIYIMKCGCELRRDDLMLIKTGLACPQHKERVAHRKRECFDCDAVYPIGTYGFGPPRCPECTKKYNEKKRLGKKNNTPIPPQNGPAPMPTKKRISAYEKFCVDPRGGYCKNCLVCQKKNALNCASCDKFDPIFKGVDPGKRKTK